MTHGDWWMPALDQIHDAVRSALEKDGWAITFDPYRIDFLELRLFADLGAERSLGAQRGDQRIVVETKSFLGVSALQEFKLALGQYVLYRAILEKLGEECDLYLAIDHDVFSVFFQQKAIQYIVNYFDMSLVVVDVKKEEIVQWKK
jgi:hypothetical protein